MGISYKTASQYILWGLIWFYLGECGKNLVCVPQ